MLRKAKGTEKNGESNPSLEAPARPPVTGGSWRGWFPLAVAASIAGGATTVAFSIWWFAEVKTHCGAVRFYEQSFGLALLGGWTLATAAGLLAAGIGRRRNARTIVMGSAVAILANIGSVLLSVGMICGVNEADYAGRDTGELMVLLAGDDLDARIFSAHALGERRAIEALVPLCEILDDSREDTNLRHNAAIALGKICAAPRPKANAVDRALASLTGALMDRDEYLPCSVIQALENIKEARGVGPLVEFLNDRSRPTHSRQDAARALAKIGGRDVLAALKQARDDAKDADLTAAIDRIVLDLSAED